LFVRAGKSRGITIRKTAITCYASALIEIISLFTLVTVKFITHTRLLAIIDLTIWSSAALAEPVVRVEAIITDCTLTYVPAITRPYTNSTVWLSFAGLAITSIIPGLDA